MSEPTDQPEAQIQSAIEPMLTMADIASIIQTSPRTIRQWRAQGLLPTPDFEHGKTIRWKRSTIDTWIDGQSQ